MTTSPLVRKMDKFSSFRQQINVAIVGCVSVGKSTLNNALFVEQLSDCHMKRTTAVPQLYHELTRRETQIAKGEIPAGEHDMHASEIADIRAANRERNVAAMSATLEGKALTLSDITPVEYIVPKIKGIVDLVGDVHGNDVVLTIHDLPGLNDAKTKSVYFEHIRATRKEIDLYIFVTDITSGCNTSEEVEIVELVGECIKANEADKIQSKLLVVVNKCDELVNMENKAPYPVDDEQQEMLAQIVKVVEHTTPGYHLACVSGEDAFIYRMVMAGRFDDLDDKYIAKLGGIEFGRRRWAGMTGEQRRKRVADMLDAKACAEGVSMSGFTYLAKVLRKIFTRKTQYAFLLNHYRNALEARALSPLAMDISEDLVWFRAMDVRLCMLNILFNKIKPEHTVLYTDKLNAFMAAHLTHITDACASQAATPADALLAAKTRLSTTKARVFHFCAETVKNIVHHLNGKMNAGLLLKIDSAETPYDEVVGALTQLKENDYDGVEALARREVFEGTIRRIKACRNRGSSEVNSFIARVGALVGLNTDTLLRARLNACYELMHLEPAIGALARLFEETRVKSESPLFFSYCALRAQFNHLLAEHEQHSPPTFENNDNDPPDSCPLVDAIDTALREQNHVAV